MLGTGADPLVCASLRLHNVIQTQIMTKQSLANTTFVHEKVGGPTDLWSRVNPGICGSGVTGGSDIKAVQVKWDPWKWWKACRPNCAALITFLCACVCVCVIRLS